LSFMMASYARAVAGALTRMSVKIFG